MACPICDNKPPNCDCTELERWQHEEIERLTAELERHRMTEEERKAADAASLRALKSCADEVWQPILRYLDRTAPEKVGRE